MTLNGTCVIHSVSYPLSQNVLESFGVRRGFFFPDLGKPYFVGVFAVHTLLP